MRLARNTNLPGRSYSENPLPARSFADSVPPPRRAVKTRPESLERAFAERRGCRIPGPWELGPPQVGPGRHRSDDGMVPRTPALIDRLRRAPALGRSRTLAPLAALACLELWPRRPAGLPWVEALVAALALAWGQALFAPGGARGKPGRRPFQAVLPALAALLAFDVSFLVTCLDSFGRLPPRLADPRGGPVLLYGATAAIVAARTVAPNAFGLLAVAALALAVDLSSPGSGVVSAASSLVAILAAASPESAAVIPHRGRSAAPSLSALARWNEGPLDVGGAARVDWVLFERGGVLSLGTPSVKRIVPLQAGVSELDVLEAAALAEYTVRNPLRDAIVSLYRSGRRTLPRLERAQYLPGRGVRRSQGGEETLAGNVRLFREAGWTGDRLRFLEETAQALSSGGETVLFVSSGEDVLGALAVFDPPRPEAGACLEALRRMGVEAAMASGDASFSVAAWARALPRIEVHAEADPNDRRALLEARRSEGRRVAAVRRRIASGASLEGGCGPSLEWGFDRSRPGIFLGAAERDLRRQVLLEDEGPGGVVAFLSGCRAICRRETWAAASVVAYHAAALPLVSGIAFGWAGVPALPALGGLLGALLPSALNTRGSGREAVPASGRPRTPTREAEARGHR